MKEKKQGFTLIELLAVIVILAIIALIATPIVLNIIKTSRKGAFARSAEGVLKASKLYYTSSLVEDITPTEITFKCNNIECISSEKSIKLDVDGNMGTGNVTITGDGKVSFELGNGTYCAEKKQDSNDIKVSKKICGELVINKPSDLKITYKTEKAGEITVVGSVSNDDTEIKSYEFSIDNGATWEKAEGKIYTFKNLEIGKEYKVLMRVTNLKNEQEQIELEPITTSLINDIEYDISNKNEWSVSKTVTITGPEIDENIYKIIYSLDGINYQDYIEPIKFTENGAIKVDIVKKEDNTSILNKIITINVIKIDDTKPSEVTFTYESKTEGLVITANAIDEESGIYGYQFSIDNGNTFTDIQTSNEYIFKNLVSGTTYNLIVKAINNTYNASGLIDNNSSNSDMQEFKFTNFKVKEITYGLAIDTNDNLWSWGANDSGQLGNGTTDNKLNVFTKISFDGTPKKICSSGNSKYVIDSNGDLWSWGNNKYGQLGNGGTSNVLVPTKLNLSFKVSDIACESSSSILLDIDGNLYAWGNNDYGNLGTSNKYPTLLASGIKFKSIDTYGEAHVAVSVNGEIYRWGREAKGNGTTLIVSKEPTLKYNNKNFVKTVVSNYGHLIALDENGHLWTQGSNGNGQLGNGSTSYSSSLNSIMEDTKFIDIAIFSSTSYALDENGNLYAWGANNSGQFGNNSREDSSVPIKVNIPTKIKKTTEKYAIDENNDAWIWGSNNGYSGDGTTIDACPPIKIG